MNSLGGLLKLNPKFWVFLLSLAIFGYVTFLLTKGSRKTDNQTKSHKSAFRNETTNYEIILSPKLANGMLNVKVKVPADGSVKMSPVQSLPFTSTMSSASHSVTELSLISGLNPTQKRRWAEVADTQIKGPISIFFENAKIKPPAIGADLFLNMAELLPFILEGPAAVDVIVLDDDVELASTAESCGSQCIHFSNFAEAVQAPIFVGGKSLIIGKGQPLEILVSRQTDKVLGRALRQALEASEKLSLKALNFLGSRWGVIDTSVPFRMHGIVNKGNSLAKTEHVGGNIIPFGISLSELDLKNSFSSAMVHQLIHEWNGKRFYPVEYSRNDFSQFEFLRISRCYFVEGFTEGFARILLAQLSDDPSTVKYIDSLWVQTLQRIYGYFVNRNKSVEEFLFSKNAKISDWGAFFSLVIAASAKRQFGEQAAKDFFWSILPSIKSSDGKTFDHKNALWKNLTFKGTLSQLQDGLALGYDEKSVETSLRNSLALSNWDELFSLFRGSDKTLNTDQSFYHILSLVSDGAGVEIKSGLVSERVSFQIERHTSTSSWPF